MWSSANGDLCGSRKSNKVILGQLYMVDIRDEPEILLRVSNHLLLGMFTVFFRLDPTL